MIFLLTLTITFNTIDPSRRFKIMFFNLYSSSWQMPNECIYD